MTGYAHANYAASLAEFGELRRLPGCRGWLLERTIPGQSERDVAGLYPLFCCEDWARLEGDLRDLGNDLVSVVLVADPFAPLETKLWQKAFNHGIFPFKEHLVQDLTRPWQPPSSHRRHLRKAAQLIEVERVAYPLLWYETWCRLYRNLIDRHDITGLAVFSNRAFAYQLATPGIVAFRAESEGETIGMLLWFVQGEVGYYHLGAFSDLGYERGASYALFSASVQAFSAELRWLDFGAEPGLSSDASSGLQRFKRGWANDSRSCYLCKHVVNPKRYAELSAAISSNTYFPAYRAPQIDMLEVQLA